MGYRKLEVKKGAMAMYVILLAVALGLMLTARQCSTKRIGERPDDIAGGDTLNVAIEISPTGLSLGGIHCRAHITTYCGTSAVVTTNQ